MRGRRSCSRPAKTVQRQIRDARAANLAFAREALAGSAAGILAVEGGWYITVQVPRIRGEEQWALDLLDREACWCSPGFFYDFESEAFLVVSLLTAPDVFREGILRLRRTSRPAEPTRSPPQPRPRAPAPERRPLGSAPAVWVPRERAMASRTITSANLD